MPGSYPRTIAVKLTIDVGDFFTRINEAEKRIDKFVKTLSAFKAAIGAPMETVKQATQALRTAEKALAVTKEKTRERRKEKRTVEDQASLEERLKALTKLKAREQSMLNRQLSNQRAVWTDVTRIGFMAWMTTMMIQRSIEGVVSRSLEWSAAFEDVTDTMIDALTPVLEQVEIILEGLEPLIETFADYMEALPTPIHSIIAGLLVFGPLISKAAGWVTALFGTFKRFTTSQEKSRLTQQEMNALKEKQAAIEQRILGIRKRISIEEHEAARVAKSRAVASAAVKEAIEAGTLGAGRKPTKRQAKLFEMRTFLRDVQQRVRAGELTAAQARTMAFGQWGAPAKARQLKLRGFQPTPTPTGRPSLPRTIAALDQQLAGVRDITREQELYNKVLRETHASIGDARVGHLQLGKFVGKANTRLRRFGGTFTGIAKKAGVLGIAMFALAPIIAGLSPMLEPASEAIEAFFEPLEPAFALVGDWIEQHSPLVVGFIEEMVRGFEKWIASLPPEFLAGLAQNLNTIGTAFVAVGAGIAALLNWTQPLTTDIGGIATGFEGMGQAGEDAATTFAVWSETANSFRGVLNALAFVFGTIMNVVRELQEAFATWLTTTDEGAQFMHALHTIAQALGVAFKYIFDAVGWLIEKFGIAIQFMNDTGIAAAALGILFEPLRLFIVGIGAAIEFLAPLWEGWMAGIAVAQGAIGGFSEIWEGFIAWLTLVGEIWTAFWAGIQGIIGTWIGPIVNAVGTFINILVDIWNGLIALANAALAILGLPLLPYAEHVPILIPELQTGGFIKKEGLFHLHPGEVVVPAEGAGYAGATVTNEFYITATIREEADIHRLAEQITELQDQEMSRRGVGYRY